MVQTMHWDTVCQPRNHSDNQNAGVGSDPSLTPSSEEVLSLPPTVPSVGMMRDLCAPPPPVDTGHHHCLGLRDQYRNAMLIGRSVRFVYGSIWPLKVLWPRGRVLLEPETVMVVFSAHSPLLWCVSHTALP